MGALNSKPDKRARMTFRIRSVGPMTLANYTEQELTQLRQAVTRKNSKVKYLLQCKMDSDLQVVAQATDKQAVELCLARGAWASPGHLALR